MELKRENARQKKPKLHAKMIGRLQAYEHNLQRRMYVAILLFGFTWGMLRVCLHDHPLAKLSWSRP